MDVTKFPAPIWHKQDGGPYIGSGSLVVMRDPDDGWINASIYRVQVHGPEQLTIQFDHGGRHGAIIAKKYWDQGKSCPVAIVGGEDPALLHRRASNIWRRASRNSILPAPSKALRSRSIRAR